MIRFIHSSGCRAGFDFTNEYEKVATWQKAEGAGGYLKKTDQELYRYLPWYR